MARLELKDPSKARCSALEDARNFGFWLAQSQNVEVSGPRYYAHNDLQAGCQRILTRALYGKREPTTKAGCLGLSFLELGARGVS